MKRRKAVKRLEVRLKAYDEMKLRDEQKRAFTKPGSMSK